MAFSIDNARNIVMFLLQKNNYGSVPPNQFNSFCELAQLSIFESLFYSDNYDTIKKNNHLTNSQYADLKKIREEQIDVYSIYSTQSNFIYDNTSKVWKFVGNDMYRAIDLSLVNNTTNKKTSIELGLKTQLNYAVNSNINPPNIYFPEYCRIGNDFKIYPEDITNHYIELLYLRKPKTPKWTYRNIGGNPIYDASASDKQDIDLHISLFEKFIVKVCSYAGLSLRENDVIQASLNEEAGINQKQL